MPLGMSWHNGPRLALGDGMTRLLNRTRSQRGFSLLEMLATLAIAGVVGGMATAQMASVRRSMEGDGAMRLVMTQMVTARETAVTQRRNIDVVFTGTNWVQTVRHEVPAGTTTLTSVAFEGKVQYALLPSISDTPDLFGTANGVAFGGLTTLTFNSDGTLVDNAGNPINGTVFLAVPNITQSQRAVTVMGSTGRVRGYKWTGSGWIRI
jgi:prepilin-type N-terminal cleavage/methylation domain-containing protein